MKIEKTHVQIKDLVEGYKDSGEEGVVAFGGLLNVRPKYQREFIYEDKQQIAVIDTVLKGFPLSTIYWVENEDGTYEVLDGQQRILSICKYYEGTALCVEIDGEKFYSGGLMNRKPALYEQFMNYELDVYVCKVSTNDDRLDWFKTINIAGEKLTDQELRNINYTGQWLSDAKKYFSKTNCEAARLSQTKEKYVTGSPIRQELLEKALFWITNNKKGKAGGDAIKDYMSQHQNDENANELKTYFKDVIDWAKKMFTYNTIMPKVEWGLLYNTFKKDYPQKFELYQMSTIKKEEFEEYQKTLNDEIDNLMADESVTNQKGIYTYIFDKNKDEKVLSIRKFTDAQKRRAFAKQNGICPICKKKFKQAEMEAHHKIPWKNGGKTEDSNCIMLCNDCHSNAHANAQV